jgi:hypothetical protein
MREPRRPPKGRRSRSPQRLDAHALRGGIQPAYVNTVGGRSARIGDAEQESALQTGQRPHIARWS